MSVVTFEHRTAHDLWRLAAKWLMGLLHVYTHLILPDASLDRLQRWMVEGREAMLKNPESCFEGPIPVGDMFAVGAGLYSTALLAVFSISVANGDTTKMPDVMTELLCQTEKNATAAAISFVVAHGADLLSWELQGTQEDYECHCGGGEMVGITFVRGIGLVASAYGVLTTCSQPEALVRRWASMAVGQWRPLLDVTVDFTFQGSGQLQNIWDDLKGTTNCNLPPDMRKLTQQLRDKFPRGATAAGALLRLEVLTFVPMSMCDWEEHFGLVEGERRKKGHPHCACDGMTSVEQAVLERCSGAIKQFACPVQCPDLDLLRQRISNKVVIKL